MKNIREQKHVDLSVIIPLYNEEDSIIHLYKAIKAVVSNLDLNYEIIFVDDGSRDKTFELAEQLAAQDPQLRVVKFRRNYGQTPAMSAGIDIARGEILVTMDGDLQNDPKDIPLFLEKINEGFDIVVGWRYKRKDKLLTRKIPSIIANWIIGKVTGVPIRDNGCSLKAYKSKIIKNIPLYSEMHRFIPAMTSLSGARIVEIKVRHHPRKFGVSKYGLSRIYKVILDLLTIRTILSISLRPFHWFAYLSFIPIAIGIFYLMFSLTNIIDIRQTSLVITFGISMLLNFLGVFLLFCGILAELIYKSGDLKVIKLSKLTANFGVMKKIHQINKIKDISTYEITK